MNDKTFADVTFVIDGKEFRYHKCILAFESYYFKTMFTTTHYSNNHVYTIKDVSMDIFEKIIIFIYTHKIIIGLEEYPEIANLAELYQIPKLKEECNKYIKDTRISVINFLEVLPYIVNMDYLKFNYMKFISTNWNDIIKEDKFYEILNKNKTLLYDIFNSVNLKSFTVTCIEEEDREKLKKYLNDKITNLTPTIQHRILEAISTDDFFKDVRNIKELLLECKISLPAFMKKY